MGNPDRVISTAVVADSGATGNAIPYDKMLAVLSKQTEAVKNQMDELSGKSNISIVTMFHLQMQMNKLSQLSEMSANVLSSANTSIGSMARAIK